MNFKKPNRLLYYTRNWKKILLIPGFLIFFCPTIYLTSQTVILSPKDYQLWENLSIYLYPKSYFQETEAVRLNEDFIDNGFNIAQSGVYELMQLQLRSKNDSKNLDYSISLDHYSESDTLFIEYDTLIKKAKKSNQKTIEDQQRWKELGKIVSKRYSRFLSKKLNSKKIESDIRNGKYFETPYQDLRAINDFEGLKDSELDSIWYYKFFNLSLSDRDLFFLYLEKLNEQQIDFQINCNRLSRLIKRFSMLYYLTTPSQERKARLPSLFQSANHKSYICNSEELIALYYAFFLINNYGLSQQKDHPYAMDLESLSLLINKLTNEQFKEYFFGFLNSLQINPLTEEIKLVSTTNRTTLLSEFFDKPYVILDFWATWCKPCIKAFPNLKILNEKWSQKMNLISISVDNDFKRFGRWTASNTQYDWPFLHSGLDHPLVKDLNVRAFPTYLIYNTRTKEIKGPYHTVEEIQEFLMVN